MIRKTGIILFSLFSGLFLCGSGGELTESDARRLITDYLGFPKPLISVVHPGPAGSPDVQKFKKGIDKMIKSGYVKEVPPGAGKDRDYQPTSKAAGYVNGVHVKKSLPFFEGAVSRQIVTRIDEIRYDNRHKTAVISFTLGLEPVQPFYSYFCINGYCDYFGEKIKKTERQKLRVKKTDRGWGLGN